MSTVIKGGTIVTSDLTFQSDVLIEKGKIASIGIKVSKWTTYHGFSLNISEELSGFNLINPCGNSNEEIAAVHQFNKEVSFKEIVEEVSDEFINKFNYEIDRVKI